MPRPGTVKFDFYPDAIVQELLKQLPSGAKNSTLNNLVTAFLSKDVGVREEAESNLIEVIRRHNKTSSSEYAGSFTDTANRLHQTFNHLCENHEIKVTTESPRYGTLIFWQQLRKQNIDPREVSLLNLNVQSAFFHTVAEMRFWQSQLEPSAVIQHRDLDERRSWSWLGSICGISHVKLKLTGAFIISWSFFEYELEKAIWRLSNTNPTGIRPKTDSMQASLRLEEFRKLTASFGTSEWHRLTENAANAIENCIQIRNTIAHGHVLPAGVGGGILNNPSLQGELRKRDAQSFHMSEQTLTMMLDATYDLIVFMRSITISPQDPFSDPLVLAMSTKMAQANSGSGEVRYLAQCVNNEKY